jgi:choline dehydrogenase-like flavoprotein
VIQFPVVCDLCVQQTHVYDFVVIGAGMIGIITLSEGLRQGATNICLLESKSR